MYTKVKINKKFKKELAEAKKELQGNPDELDRIDIVNPRNDRKLSTHANSDTGIARNPEERINTALKMIGLNPEDIKYVVKPNNLNIIGNFGKCSYNVLNNVNKIGGDIIYGYMIYVNKYVVEFEAHCVWLFNDVFYNVTWSINVGDNLGCNNVFEGLFIIDDNMKPESRDNYGLFCNPPQRLAPNNKIVWLDKDILMKVPVCKNCKSRKKRCTKCIKKIKDNKKKSEAKKWLKNGSRESKSISFILTFLYIIYIQNFKFYSVKLYFQQPLHI